MPGKKQKPESEKSISRREFALGSMGLLSAYAIAQNVQPTPLSARAQAIKLQKSQFVQDLLDARHILDEDIKRVIDHAEQTGEKLYQPGTNRFLSKLRIKEACFYVEYEPIGEAYQVHTAYSHRFMFAREE